MSVTTGFRVGRGIGIIHDSTLALFEPLNGDLAGSLWELVCSGAGIDELLEELSSTGLRSLGSFAMAQFEEAQTRVVVRGAARVLITGSAGKRSIAAHGVRTWVEEVIDGVEAIELSLAEPADAVLPFRAQRALLPADVLQHGVAVDPEVRHVAFNWIEDFDPSDAFSGSPPGARGPIGQASIDLSPSGDRDEADVGLPEVAPVPPPVAPATDPRRTMTASDIWEYSEANALQADSPVTIPNAIVESEPDAGDEYDEIYGRTMARTVGGAAVHTPEDPPDAADPVAVAPDVSPGAESPPAPPPPAPTGAGTIALIEGIPSSASPALGDHDGRTMTKAQIAALRAAQSGSLQPAAPSVMGGPTVQALICPNQHPNPPQLQVCRVCHTHLGAAPVHISRPSLGVLRFSTGTTVSLDRPVLIGRNPKVEGGLAGEIPQLVKMDVGPGLSRTHASIRLEGWQVLLEDLNSANGTIVRLPGREPRRLHPGEPVLLEVGSDVDLGGEISCVLE